MNGKVDPYAQWTDDHVEDDGLTIVPSDRPGDELLDPPKLTLDDGVGDIEPGGGIEDVGTEEGQLAGSGRISNQAASEWPQSTGTGRHERLRQSYETSDSRRALELTQDEGVPVGPVGLEPTRFGLKVRCSANWSYRPVGAGYPSLWLRVRCTGV